jgi:hypothetical protein
MPTGGMQASASGVPSIPTAGPLVSGQSVPVAINMNPAIPGSVSMSMPSMSSGISVQIGTTPMNMSNLSIVGSAVGTAQSGQIGPAVIGIPNIGPGIPTQQMGPGFTQQRPQLPVASGQTSQMVTSIGQQTMLQSQTSVSNNPGSISLNQTQQPINPLQISSGQPQISVGQALTSAGQAQITTGMGQMPFGQSNTSAGQPAMSVGQQPMSVVNPPVTMVSSMTGIQSIQVVSSVPQQAMHATPFGSANSPAMPTNSFIDTVPFPTNGSGMSAEASGIIGPNAVIEQSATVAGGPSQQPQSQRFIWTG